MIDSVTTSCGCTDVQYPHNPILPDETGDVTVLIDLTDEIGTFSHMICVFFHNQRPVVLKVMGNVKRNVAEET